MARGSNPSLSAIKSDRNLAILPSDLIIARLTPASTRIRFRNPSGHFGFEPSALVEDGDSLSHYQRFDEDVETVSLRVLGARDFEGGDSSTTITCGAKLLRGSPAILSGQSV